MVARDLYDVWPRKVYFFPETGKVLVKKLRTLRNDTVGRREHEYLERITPCRGFRRVRAVRQGAR